jgi:hypothetical protein
MTSLVWASCVTCGADALATPEKAREARCASCHWEAAHTATVPNTVAVSCGRVPEPAPVARAVSTVEPEPARTVETDILAARRMVALAHTHGWETKVAGTYGGGTEMIGVWMRSGTVTCAAFWSRKYDAKKWVAAGTYVNGRPPFTAMNHTDLREWLPGLDPLVIQRARVRKLPVHTCEPPDKKVVHRRSAEHGG